MKKSIIGGIAMGLLLAFSSSCYTNAQWDIVQTVDEFGDATDSGAIGETITGTFSNSATVDSELTVNVICDIPYLRFDLLEYNDQPVMFSSYDEITLKTKIADNVYEYDCSGLVDNNYLYVKILSDTSVATELGCALLGGQEVKCVLYVNSSKYNFTLDGTNLTTSIDKSFGIEREITEVEQTDAQVAIDDIVSQIYTASYYFGDTNYENNEQYEEDWIYLYDHIDDFEVLSAEDLSQELLGTWQEIYYYYFKIGYRTLFPDGTASSTIKLSERNRVWSTEEGTLLYGIDNPSPALIWKIDADTFLLYDSYWKYILLRRV